MEGLVLRRADRIDEVLDIVRETIAVVYPRFYPAGAVRYFFGLHDEDRIGRSMETDKVYLLVDGDVVVGTGSVRKNEIYRFFVLPRFQRRGYGNSALDLMEERIFAEYPSVRVDASLPAERLYRKRGYAIRDFEMIETGNGDFLCYHTMEKRRV